MDKIEISSLPLSEVELALESLGEKKFRGKQIYEWIHQKLVVDFDEMTNVSKELREKLKTQFEITQLTIEEKQRSKSDGTTKYLFQTKDQLLIESVLMKYEFGNSVCVSTQAGCRMGCKFCASTLHGLDRNLTTGEILAQVYRIEKDLGERISNVVLMGSGEPLDNFDAVINFIHIINSKEGLGIGERHITLSTCGLVDQIYALAEFHLQITLAISLHASNDEVRQSLMPIANTVSIDDLLKACIYYGNTTKRRITYEYALILGVNDREANAVELGKKLKGTLAHVNLIPINDVAERNFEQSSSYKMEQFATILRRFGIETTIRRKMGSDINAACGQLRNAKKL